MKSGRRLERRLNRVRRLRTNSAKRNYQALLGSWRSEATPDCGTVELDRQGCLGTPDRVRHGASARGGNRSGIYLLTGTDPESDRPAIYIGEAECIRDRVKGHNDKDFWNQITFFVSKDENLTKAHIRHLEGKLIELGRAVDRAVVTNGQGSGSKLPESDRGEMEVFLEKITQLLPVLGVDLLVPTSSGASETRETWR